MRPATLLAAVLLATGGSAARDHCAVRAAGPNEAAPPAVSPAAAIAETAAAAVPLPIETNRAPPADALYRPPVDVDSDPPAFYARTHYRERGLARNAGGWDADARGWVASFRQFQTQALRPTRERHTIDLVPMGEMTYRMRKRTRLVREFLQVYLTLPVRMREPAPLGGRPVRTVLVAGRIVRQFEAGDLKTRVLVPHLRPDTLAMVGITAEDLYSTLVDWDCVGNQTSTGRGFAVCSLARLFPEFHNARPTAKAERRGMDLAFRMVADAAVGMLGHTPCRKYYCVMNQAKVTSMREPVHLCPDCLRKLRWSFGFDLIERYQALRRFYCRAGLMDEARWVLQRLKECVPAADAARTAPAGTANGAAAVDEAPAVFTLPAPATAAGHAAPGNPYRPPARVEDDPPGFYASPSWRERGLSRNAGGFDADARDWIVPFRRYVASEPLRPTRGRHTIVLVPLGPQNERTERRIGRVRDFLAAYLTLPVQTWPAAPLAGRPSRQAKVAGRTVRQYEAEDILDTMLEPQRTRQALALVGLATQDLYSKREDWPSVAHVSRTGRGLAVVSLARTFPAFFRKESRADHLCRDLRLTFGMAADAACRSLGLTPCRKYYCVMNQARRSSTVEPLHLCPDCLRKLRWTLGFDLADRYEALGRFYEETGLPVEATWVRRRMGECRKAIHDASE